MSNDKTKARQTTFAIKLFQEALQDVFAWEETANPTVFQVPLTSFVIQVRQVEDEMVGELFAQIELLNKAGVMLETIYPGGIDSTVFQDATGRSPGPAFDEIYEVARRKALNVDDALAKATKEVEEYPF